MHGSRIQTSAWPVQHGIVETKYYPFIDGLRGLAVLMVLALHTSLFTAAIPEESASTLIANGGKGVQLFFVLSAFTLFSTSWQRFPREQSPRRNFYIRRAFRILPLWWLAIALYAVACTYPGFRTDSLPPSAKEIALDAFFLFGFFPSHCRPLVLGGWSLFIEETFYLFLPLIFAYVVSLERAATLTLGLVAVSVAWNPVSRFLLHGNPRWSTFYFLFPLSQWFIFGLGFVLYFLVAHRTTRPSLPSSVMRLCDLVVGIGLWAVLVGHPIGPDFYAGSCALAALCWAASEKGSLWGGLTNTRVLRTYGQCCFSIYLFQGLMLQMAAPFRDRFLSAVGLGDGRPEVRYLVCFVVMALASLVVGQASFHFFEKPMVRKGQRVIAWLAARDTPIEASPTEA